jgi:hypothetical protein
MSRDPACVEHIETFAAGDTVPEWLIEIDPTKPQRARLDLVFNVAVAVVKVWGEYWLLPEAKDISSIIRGRGDGGDYAIRATDVPIVMPLQFHIMGRPGGFTLRLCGDEK